MDELTIARFAEACGAAAPLDLVVEPEDGSVVAEGSLEQPFALVGRDPECDLTLLDPAVSLRHAVLQVVGGRVFAAELGGTAGWLDPGEAVRVGPFRVTLANPVSDRPAGSAVHPLGPGLPAGLPRVAIEFRTGRSSATSWAVDRVLTTVGRAAGCKLRLGGDDVSDFHCYLLLTPDGLWVVDLLGRGGVWVNGELTRLARLGHGDEVRVGRFVLGCAYPDAPADRSSAILPFPAAPAPAAGFEAAVGPVLRQMGAMQGEMFGQFQQSLVMMMQMFGQMHQEQMAAVQRELTRMAELTAELHKLQAELARKPAPALPAAPARVNPLPVPEAAPPVSADTADLHNQVWERMANLDAERQSIWRRLFKAA